MSQNINLLKELLFDREVRELDELQQRVNAVYEKAGSDERLRKSVSEILGGAIADAEKQNHDAMRRAVAPLVVKTVETKITSKQHTDFISGAVSKNMAKIVRDYVDSAIKDLMAKINKKLEKAIPGGARKMRTRAETRGMSMAEVALAESQKLEVEELYLIRRGSGTVIAHWSRDDEQSGASDANPNIGSNRDAIVGGYLTAITNVAKEAFDMDNAGIRAIQHSDFQIYLRNSPVYTLAAKCSGIALPGMESAIDMEFQRIIAEHDNLIAAAAGSGKSQAGNGSLNNGAAGAAQEADHKAKLKEILPGLAASLEARMAKTHEELFEEVPVGMSPITKMAWLIGVPLLALLAWFGWQSYWTADTDAKVRHEISQTADLRGYPLNIAVARGGSEVRLSGLTPSDDVRQELIGRLRKKLRGVEIMEELSVLPKTETVDPTPQIAAVKRDITQLEARSTKVIDDLAAANAKKISALEMQIIRAGITRAVDRAGRRLGTVVPELAALQQRLGNSPEADDVSTSLDTVKSAETALASLVRRIGARDTRDTPLATLPAELNRITVTINNAVARLARLSGLRSTAGTQDVTTVDPAESAEELALAAERLSMVSGSTARTVVLKPVQRRVGDISTSVSSLSKRVDDLLPGARQRLEAWTRANAIFFASDAQFLNSRRARAKLDSLAKLLGDSKLIIRVIGFTDEVGNQTRNAPLASTLR